MRIRKKLKGVSRSIQSAVTQVVDYACHVVLSVVEMVTASRPRRRRGKDEW